MSAVSKERPVVLLVGRLPTVLGDAAEHLSALNVTVRSSTDLDEVRKAFADGPVHHLIMGAGLDLERRLEIVREVYARSEITTVHLKDVASSREGFLPFVVSVLTGMASLH